MGTKPGTARDKAAAMENADKAARNTEPKRTRTVLTPAQRIEKAKADLAALEAKEANKAKAKHAAALDELSALRAKAKDIQSKVDAKEAEVNELHAVAFPANGAGVAESTDES